MAKYRKKPVVIEAVQFTGYNFQELEQMRTSGRTFIPDDPGKAATHLIIGTLEGDHRADVGDWIIKGVQGNCILANLRSSPPRMSRLECLTSLR